MVGIIISAIIMALALVFLFIGFTQNKDVFKKWGYIALAAACIFGYIAWQEL